MKNVYILMYTNSNALYRHYKARWNRHNALYLTCRHTGRHVTWWSSLESTLEKCRAPPADTLILYCTIPCMLRRGWKLSTRAWLMTFSSKEQLTCTCTFTLPPAAGHSIRIRNQHKHLDVAFLCTEYSTAEQPSPHLFVGASCKNICLIRKAVNYSGMV